MAHLPDAIYPDPRYLNLQQENIKRCILCNVEGVGGGPPAGDYGEICRDFKSLGDAISEHRVVCQETNSDGTGHRSISPDSTLLCGFRNVEHHTYIYDLRPILWQAILAATFQRSLLLPGGCWPGPLLGDIMSMRGEPIAIVRRA